MNKNKVNEIIVLSENKNCHKNSFYQKRGLFHINNSSLQDMIVDINIIHFVDLILI